MAADQNSLTAQAEAVHRVVRHQHGKGRKVPQLEAAEQTLRSLALLADDLRRAANEDTPEIVTDDFANRMLTILRLPVVKA